MPNSAKGTIALKYCRENPDMATQTLARKMLTETAPTYTSLDQARSAVRRYRGQHGDNMRKDVKVCDCYTGPGDERRDNNVAGSTTAQAKILVFDIETSPNMAYVWRCYKENVMPSQMITETKVICWSAKWLGDDHVMYDSIQNDMDGDGSLQAWIEQDDSRVCATLYELFNEADVVVAHNGQAFDTTHMNTRWMAMGFQPPQPYQVYDTLRESRKTFNFPTNKLDGIARYLNLGTKKPHEGFGLWVKCMAGDKDAWKTMEEYCVHDTLLLEKVYMKIRAWSTRHPNLDTIIGGYSMRCTVCGSTKMHEVDKDTCTDASRFPTYRCEGCGHVMRGRKRYKPERPVEERLAR